MSSAAENFARRIVQRLQGAGHVAYFAGGCVRDQLMGRVPKDYDVATSAKPEQVLGLFPRGQKVGAAFGVILLVERFQGERLQVEVATFRTDGTYSDGRHPDAVEFTTAEIDAQRRDFTCNGLFFDPLANGGAGAIHDYVGGQADIQAKILRAIGDPEARFREDHLRMLRAVRFAARLGFAIDPATHAAIVKNAPNIRTVSRERIHDELALILEHATRATAAQMLQSTQLLHQIWPPALWEQPTWKHHFSGLRMLPPVCDGIAALATLFKDLAWLPGTSPAVVPPPLRIPAAVVADHLRNALLLSNTETADLAWLLENLTTLLPWQSLPKSALKHLLANARWSRLETLFVHLSLDPSLRGAFIARVAELRAEGVAPAPFITGDTLIQLGAKPGPNFKRWLDALYDRQLELELTTKEQALAAARELIASG
jgi:poly(A) polymerase